jgi:hypothetical protein
MKARTFVSIFILVLAVMIIVSSCATMKSPDSMTYERFCGTWVNTEYDGKVDPPVKQIFNPDGTMTYYSQLHNTATYGRVSYTVEKRWTDSEGNSWYHVKETWPIETTGTGYLLVKLERYNTILEYNYSGTDYPTEIGPTVKYSDYRIYYRY